MAEQQGTCPELLQKYIQLYTQYFTNVYAKYAPNDLHKVNHLIEKYSSNLTQLKCVYHQLIHKYKVAEDDIEPETAETKVLLAQIATLKADESDSDDDCDLVQDPINLAVYPPRSPRHHSINKNTRKRTLDESEVDEHRETVSATHTDENERKNKEAEQKNNHNKNGKPPLKRHRSDLDITKAMSKQCGTSTTEKHWNVSPGLNYYGIPIHEPECVAFGERVCVHRGYGNANVIKDSKMRKCPSCQAPFELLGVFMYQCLATVKYQVGDGPLVQREYIVRDNNYIDFGEYEKMQQQILEDKKKEALKKKYNKNKNSNDENAEAKTAEPDDYRISNYKVLEFNAAPWPIVTVNAETSSISNSNGLQTQFQTQSSSMALYNGLNHNGNNNHHINGSGVNNVLNQLMNAHTMNGGNTNNHFYADNMNGMSAGHQNQQQWTIQNHNTYNNNWNGVNYNQYNNVNVSQPLSFMTTNNHANNAVVQSNVVQNQVHDVAITVPMNNEKRLQMAKNVVTAYGGRVSLQQVLDMNFDRLVALHAEIVRRITEASSNYNQM